MERNHLALLDVCPLNLTGILHTYMYMYQRDKHWFINCMLVETIKHKDTKRLSAQARVHTLGSKDGDQGGAR